MKAAALVIFLLGLLAGVIWWVVSSLSTLGGFNMPVSAWIAMVIGVLLSLGLGVGLMALTFHSSRAGHDQPPDYDNWPQPPDEPAARGSRGPSGGP
jgi:hypothetical protein